MKTFIHTCAISVNITWKESQILQNIYHWMPLDKSYKNRYYIYSVTEFCNNGLQIQIRKRKKDEVKYDTFHRPLKMELIITPYKLLYPKAHLGEILDIGKMKEALFVLEKMLYRIERETGIRIRYDYKIQRVDITCDVETPSDIYSKEIIAAIKTVKLPYGYKVPDCSEAEGKYGWVAKNASLFYNKNRGVYIKIYDKKENLRNREVYGYYSQKGLIRYEISMLRKCLVNKKLWAQDILGECLWNVMCSGDELFHEYIIDNLYDLPMFSLKVLEDYLDKKLEKKEKILEKMKNFCRIAYKCKKCGICFSPIQCNMSEDQFRKYRKKFKELGISYIPACFLQAFFGHCCKTFLDIVACPNWTKLQSTGQP